MKEEILRLLRSADCYISGQELCNRFGVSRTAVWKAINQLKEAGYEIVPISQLILKDNFHMDSTGRQLND